jgi:excisionase family DNA binding protein
MPERYLSTAAVAGALGVSVTTVKPWVDEGILPARRTSGGHRKLLEADVLRLVSSRQLPAADLAGLGAAPASSLPELARKLYDALRAGAGQEVQRLIEHAYRGGTPLVELADQVVAPAMNRLGDDWEAGRIEVFHEHRGTQACVAALYALKLLVEARAADRVAVAIGGAPEGDWSSLPSLLAELLLLEAGWKVVNLGPQTPAASFARAVKELRPRLLWLSASHIDPKMFLSEYPPVLEAAMKAGAAVVVGGRALSQDLRLQLPHTAFGDRLAQLAALANTLSPPLQIPRRGRPPRTPKT